MTSVHTRRIASTHVQTRTKKHNFFSDHSSLATNAEFRLLRTQSELEACLEAGSNQSCFLKRELFRLVLKHLYCGRNAIVQNAVERDPFRDRPTLHVLVLEGIRHEEDLFSTPPSI